jgi:hypothetical protein
MCSRELGGPVLFPPFITQAASEPWVLGLIGCGALVYLVFRPRHIFGVLILAAIVYVSWLLELPQLFGLLP